MDGYRLLCIRMWKLFVASRGSRKCAHTSCVQHRDNMFKVVSFFLRTRIATFMLRKVFFWGKMFFFSDRACSSDLVCRAFFLAPSAQGQGWCDGFNMHFVATTVRRDIPSPWQKCWLSSTTLSQNLTSHYITATLLNAAFSLTVDGEHLLEIFRVGEPSLTSLITLLFLLFLSSSPLIMTFRAHCNDLAARRLELWFKSSVRLFFFEFWLAFCKVYNDFFLKPMVLVFSRQKKLQLSFTVHLRFINWFDLKLFWAFKFFRRLRGCCAGHLSPTFTYTVKALNHSWLSSKTLSQKLTSHNITATLLNVPSHWQLTVNSFLRSPGRRHHNFGAGPPERFSQRKPSWRLGPSCACALVGSSSLSSSGAMPRVCRREGVSRSRMALLTSLWI